MNSDIDTPMVGGSLRNGVITIARCTVCGAEQAFPAPSCFNCGSPELVSAEHPGTGSIFSWVVNHHAFGSDEPELPYTVLLVELDGGARIYARLSNDAAVRSTLAAGMRATLDTASTEFAGCPVFAIAAQPKIAALDPAMERTCYQVFRQSAEAHPAHPAFELIGHRTLTYAELLSRVDQCAAMLKDKGSTAGDRIAVMSNNRSELLELWLACSRIGAVFVPFNPALRGTILADMLSLAEPFLAVCEPEWVGRLSEAAPALTTITLSELDNGITDWGAGEPGRAADDPEALTIIMFTSGTTGRSKGVMWSSMTINCMAHSVRRPSGSVRMIASIRRCQCSTAMR